MVKPAILGVLLFFGLVFPVEVGAQVVIGNFYSLETSDWVEIRNTGGSEVEITEYKVVDTTGVIHGLE